VIVIDDVLDKRLFGGQDPVGQELSVQFVGKFQDSGRTEPRQDNSLKCVKTTALNEDGHGSPQGAIYLPFFASPDAFLQITTTGMNLPARWAAGLEPSEALRHE
jgi:hypothetical protein